MMDDRVHLNNIGLDIFLLGLQNGVEQALFLLRGDGAQCRGSRLPSGGQLWWRSKWEEENVARKLATITEVACTWKVFFSCTVVCIAFSFRVVKNCNI